MSHQSELRNTFTKLVKKWMSVWSEVIRGWLKQQEKIIEDNPFFFLKSPNAWMLLFWLVEFITGI